MKLTALIGLATVAVAAFAVDGGILKLTEKVGDVRKYKLTSTVDLAGQAATVTASVVDKVLKVEDNGNITIQSAQTNMHIDAGGQAFDAPDGEPSVSVLHPDGSLVEIRGGADTKAAFRLSMLNGIRFPATAVEKDTAWNFDTAADAKTGAVKSHSDYKVLGDEKVGAIDTWKISFSTKELEGDAPASSEGTVWVSKADGTMVKTTGKWVNAPIPAAPGPVNATYSLELIP